MDGRRAEQGEEKEEEGIDRKREEQLKRSKSRQNITDWVVITVCKAPY